MRQKSFTAHSCDYVQSISSRQCPRGIDRRRGNALARPASSTYARATSRASRARATTRTSYLMSPYAASSTSVSFFTMLDVASPPRRAHSRLARALPPRGARPTGRGARAHPRTRTRPTRPIARGGRGRGRTDSSSHDRSIVSTPARVIRAARHRGAHRPVVTRRDPPPSRGRRRRAGGALARLAPRRHTARARGAAWTRRETFARA